MRGTPKPEDITAYEVALRMDANPYMKETTFHLHYKTGSAALPRATHHHEFRELDEAIRLIVGLFGLLASDADSRATLYAEAEKLMEVKA